ncbi:MAG: zf-HC2 domain-containing protein [Clostridiales bacterium]
MKCREAQILINIAIDGMLDSQNQSLLDQHLLSCASCRQFQKQALQLDALLSKKLRSVEPPADFTASVMAALPEKRASFHLPRLFPNLATYRKYGLCSAALALIIVSGSMGLFQEGEDIIPPVNPNTTVANQLPADKNLTNQKENKPLENKLNEVNKVNKVNNQEAPIKVEEKEKPSANSQPDNNKTANNKPPIKQEPTKTESNPNPKNPTPVGQSGQVYLPKVAYGTHLKGNFSLTLLVEHEGLNTYAPYINAEGNVEYFVKNNNGYQLWQQDINAAQAPIMLSGSVDKPTISGNNHNPDNAAWAEGLDGYVAISPDSSMAAANIKGVDKGLWISDNNSQAEPIILSNKAGGGLLCWSSNSGKIAFNDQNGNLYIAYPTEKLVLSAYSGEVKSVAWSADDKILIFCAKDPQDGLNKIYRITLP